MGTFNELFDFTVIEPMDMTVSEYFEMMKKSGKYNVYDVVEEESLFGKTTTTHYGDKPINISMIIKEDILFYSPFRFISICHTITPHRDSYSISTIDGCYSISCEPDDTMVWVINEMKYCVNEHYRILFRNIKRVKDSGRRYIIDPCWNKNEYQYLERNAEKHGIKYVKNWEDCHGYMIITDIDIDNDQHIELTTYQYDRVKGY